MTYDPWARCLVGLGICSDYMWRQKVTDKWILVLLIIS